LLNGQYYSKGKFLLTGEYLVLRGASALAVPLKFGQWMKASTFPQKGIIKWDTNINGNLWFSGTFSQKKFTVTESTAQHTARFITRLLQAGNELQPGFLNQGQGIWIQNEMDFDISWGLGSSSSLVSNFAWWLGISPFELYRKLYEGSGYDVFCARAEKPIIYQVKKNLPVFREIEFSPDFADHVYFIYLGRKQDSQHSVRDFLSNSVNDNFLIRKVSGLTNDMVNAATLDDFMDVILAHEKLISGVLGIPPVKEAMFQDFQGEIKSLGAWGGDFVMAASKMSSNDVMDYFSRKKLETVFKWEEIVYGK
jgi:mevalonate kinase